MASSNRQDVDLDLFLTAVESKLRGPFSSLDLTKTATTPALRGDVSEVQYLRQISQVLSKADKTTQMRILIGLLGLDPEPEIDETIYSILQQAQGKGEQDEDLTEEERLARQSDEWVRVIAGLIQGMMFKDEDGNQCFGEEAKDLMENTCAEIVKKVGELADQTAHLEEKDQAEGDDPNAIRTSLLTADFDPITAPYKYSLLNPNLLKDVIPDSVGPNPHFNVNESANVLNEDEKLEIAKAKEETEHIMSKQASQRNTSGNSDRAPSGAAQVPMAYMPGMKQISKTTDAAGSAASKKTAASRPRTSIFMTKKPPAAAAAKGAAGRGGGIHVRKTGAAQRLVGKGRQPQVDSGAEPRPLGRGGGALAASRTGASRLGVGRAMKAAASANGGKTKVQMLDSLDATDLAKQQDQAPQTKFSLKRKAAAARPPAKIARVGGAVGRSKAALQKVAPQEPEPEAPPSPDAEDDEEDDFAPHHYDDSSSDNNALAAAALSLYQTQFAKQAPAPAAPMENQNSALAAAALSRYQTQLAAAPVASPPAAASPSTASPPRQLNWEQLLSLKSNKLTPSDRQRVKQFFEDRINPTPQEQVFRMKLHEERTMDPSTGGPIKETYYLELDYTNFTSKQSKKVKRY